MISFAFDFYFVTRCHGENQVTVVNRVSFVKTSLTASVSASLLERTFITTRFLIISNKFSIGFRFWAVSRAVQFYNVGPVRQILNDL